MRLFLALMLLLSSEALAQGLDVDKLKGVAEATRTACLSGTQYDLTVNADGSLSLFRKLTPGAEGRTRITQNSGTGGALSYTNEGLRLIADQQIRDCVGRELPLMLMAAGAHLAAERGSPMLNLSPQEEARNRLQQLGMNWNLASFREAVLQNDQAAIELYFKGGFSPNTIYGDWATPDIFLIAVPFAQQISDRFAILELFRRHGLNFDTANPRGVRVDWMIDLRSNPGHGRNETISDEIIRFVMNEPDEAARSELNKLKTYGLTCGPYIDSYNDLVELRRVSIDSSTLRLSERLKQFPGTSGVAAEVREQMRAQGDRELGQARKNLSGYESQLDHIKRICGAK